MRSVNFLLAERLSLLDEEGRAADDDDDGLRRWRVVSPETDMQAATSHVQSGDAAAEATIEQIKSNQTL